MKGSDAIYAVSTFLADQLPREEYTRWSQKDLFISFKWALAWLAQARPTSFVITDTIQLQPGSKQDLPECCTQMVDAPGNQRIVSRRAARLVDRMRRRCPTALTGSTKYTVESYSYDANNPYSVFVYPPVPPNTKDATFEVTCSYMPSPKSPEDDITMDNSLYAAIVDLMIFHVGTGENESPTLMRTAQMRYQSVLDQLKLAGQDEQEQRRLAEEGKVNVGG